MIPKLQKGYVVTRQGIKFRTDLPIPTPEPGYLLLKVNLASICGTDIQIMKKDAWTQENVLPHLQNDKPLILGHEVCGEVVSKGAGAKTEIGTFGACESHFPCPSCQRKGLHPSSCKEYGILGVWGAIANGSRTAVLGGSFAQYILVPEVNFYDVTGLHEIFPCSLIEPIGNARTILDNLAQRGLPSSMLIFGSGPHSINLQVLARHAGVQRIAVIEPNSARQNFARNLGAANLIIEDADNTGGETFEVVLDMAGAPTIIPQIIKNNLVSNGGVVGLFGLPKEQHQMVQTQNGQVNMSDFIFRQMSSQGRTLAGNSFTFVGYTGRTDKALRGLIADLEKSHSLRSMLSKQLRITGPLDMLAGMLTQGFPYSMTPSDMKVGFTQFREG